MMKSAVLVFLISCAVCEQQGNTDQSCYVSLAMTVGALTEKVANLMDKMSQVETKLLNTEKELTELTSITRGAPQVAFSAGLLASGSGHTGPFISDTPLKYKKVFSNIGSNYNPITGLFTATVKGMYYFHFATFTNKDHPNSAVSLVKNNDHVVSVLDGGSSDYQDTGSSAAVLPLEVGDTVYVQLYSSKQVYDDGSKSYTSFAGFLLFPN